jgi:chromosome segregation ATPase
VTALAVVAALFVLHKLDLDGYVKSGVKRMKAEVHRQIPPEVKLQRLQDEIDRLPAAERQVRSTIASEMVEVKKIETQVAEARVNLEQREVALKGLKSDLEKAAQKDNEYVTLRGEKIARDKAEASLTRQWETFKTAREALKTQEGVLKARKESLGVAKAKLDAMQEKRKEMQAKVESLKLELEKLRLAQTQNNIAVDDTQLAEVMKLYDEVNTQIETQKTELSLQKGADTDAVVADAVASKAKAEKALKEMDEFFGGADKVTKKD